MWLDSITWSWMNGEDGAPWLSNYFLWFICQPDGTHIAFYYEYDNTKNVVSLSCRPAARCTEHRWVYGYSKIEEITKSLLINTGADILRAKRIAFPIHSAFIIPKTWASNRMWTWIYDYSEYRFFAVEKTWSLLSRPIRPLAFLIFLSQSDPDSSGLESQCQMYP